MTEINNNGINNLNAAKAIPAKKEEQPVAADAKLSETKQVEDLGNNPQEAIGRSQVAKADNLKNDMKIFKEKNQLVMNADQFFDYTLEQYKKEGKEDAYEKACIATAQFINEFSKNPQIKI